MIHLNNVSKIFGTGVAGLSDVTLLIDRGEFVFLVGHTGSGKTTLLRLLVRDTLPTQGSIIIDDFDIVKLPASKIPHLRKKVGVVFQDLKLLVDRTILENIILPMQVAGTHVQESLMRAEELLEMVGLSDHRDKFPVQLSGGELQRVAIARALALSPEILLADEPTGNLDPQTALEIVKILERINEMGTTIVMATHNLDIVEKLKKRVIALDKGKVVKDEKHHDKTKSISVKEKEEKEKETKEAKAEESIKPPKQDTKKSENNEEKNESEKISEKLDTPSGAIKTEEHKKETKKLSDLLAKARLTFQKHQEKKANTEAKAAAKEDMPFGFEKDMDIKMQKP